MDIDWRLAGSGNPFGQFAEGFLNGQQNKRQRERDNLFAQRQTFEIQEAQAQREKQEAAAARQAAVGAAVVKNDFTGAREASGGDMDLLKSIGEMDKARRAELAETAEFGARQLYALQGLPPEEQARRWQATVPMLVQRGAKVEELNIDFNDPGAIQRELAEAMTLKEMIAQTNAERDDRRASEKDRTDAKFRERTLAQGDARIGLAREAHRERKKSGGYGTPGAPGGSGINTAEVEWD
jgi:hypothetical protein